MVTGRRDLPDLDTRLAWLKSREVERVQSVYLERRQVGCGKRRCRCARGQPHGPFYYLRFSGLAGSRRQRVYVPRKRAREVRDWVRRFRESRAGMYLALRWIRRRYCR